MNTKIEKKSEKTICFSREKFFECLKRYTFLAAVYKTAAKTFQKRIRGLELQY